MNQFLDFCQDFEKRSNDKELLIKITDAICNALIKIIDEDDSKNCNTKERAKPPKTLKFK